MSILRVDAIRDNGAGFNDVVTFANSGGTENGKLARAWVNFNGQGAVAIRANFNVNSITDNGTGSYVVNFSNSLNISDYVVTAFICKDNEFVDEVVYPRTTPNSQHNTSGYHLYSNYGASGGAGSFDTPIYYFSAFS